MATNLTPTFERALVRRSLWSREQVLALGKEIVGQVPHARLDWDDGAGEEWASVITERTVVAVIWMHAPLAFLRVDLVSTQSLDLEIEWVPFQEFEERGFSIDQQKVDQLFGQGRWVEDISPQLFSLSELWWTTI